MIIMEPRARSRYLRICCVEGCINRKTKGGKMTFFKMPKNEEKRKLWLKACGVVDDRRNLHICERHFELDYPLQKRLSSGIMPTLFLPDQVKTNSSNNSSSLQSPDDCDNIVITDDSSESHQEIAQKDTPESTSKPTQKLSATACCTSIQTSNVVSYDSSKSQEEIQQKNSTENVSKRKHSGNSCSTLTQPISSGIDKLVSSLVSFNNRSKVESFDESCKNVVRLLQLQHETLQADQIKRTQSRSIKTYSREVPVLFLNPEKPSSLPGEKSNQILGKFSNDETVNTDSRIEDDENEYILPTCARIANEGGDTTSHKLSEKSSYSSFQLLTKDNDPLLIHEEGSGYSDNDAPNQIMCYSPQIEIERVDVEMLEENQVEPLCRKCKEFNDREIRYMKRINELENKNKLLIKKKENLITFLQKRNEKIALLKLKIKKMEKRKR